MNIDGGVRWGGGNYALKEQISPIRDIDGKVTAESRTPVLTAESRTPKHEHD